MSEEFKWDDGKDEAIVALRAQLAKAERVFIQEILALRRRMRADRDAIRAEAFEEAATMVDSFSLVGYGPREHHSMEKIPDHIADKIRALAKRPSDGQPNSRNLKCPHPAPTAKASDTPGDEYCRYCGKHLLARPSDKPQIVPGTYSEWDCCGHDMSAHKASGCIAAACDCRNVWSPRPSDTEGGSK